MEGKQNDTALLIHRPRKRRQLVHDPKQDQKSQNLKVLHQTLLCDNNQRQRYRHAERASAVQINHPNNSRSFSRKQIETSKEKEKV